jgi:hypothetical protein
LAVVSSSTCAGGSSSLPESKEETTLPRRELLGFHTSPMHNSWTKLNLRCMSRLIQMDALIFTASHESTQNVEQPLQPALWPVVPFGIVKS